MTLGGVSDFVKAETVRLPRFNDREPAFVFVNQVLVEALRRTEDPENPDKIVYENEYMTQARALECLRKNIVIDVYYTMTSAERERGLRVLRYPLLKGLLGIRGFLVHREMAPQVLKVKSLDELRRTLRVIQGEDWPDTQVLKQNRFRVTTAVNYNEGALYRHLIDRRVDAVALGVFELATEHDKFKLGADVVIVDQILLQYEAPFFFFFSNGKDKLARRVESGLLAMKKDGTYDRWFGEYFGDSIKKLTHVNTRVFEIPSPLLTSETKEALKQNRSWLLRAK